VSSELEFTLQIAHACDQQTHSMPHKMININKLNKVCVEPPSSALSVMLPAFAAEHRRLQHGACSCRLISTACRMLSSKPTGRRFCCRLMGQTDAQPLHRPCSAYYAGTSINLYLKVNLSKRLRQEYSVGHSGSLYLSMRPKSRTLV